jgi:hypothetical protein
VESFMQKGVCGGGGAGHDVFISHSSAQKLWVTALAKNLQSAGKSVFLDSWHLIPGQSWVSGLHDGLNASRAAVLVASPEAYHSGWVRAECERLAARRIADPTFTLIPIVDGTVEGSFPFTQELQWVDFRNPADYRAAFARLIGGLNGEAPGPEPRWDGELEIPDAPTGVASAPPPVATVFRKLDSTAVVMLLIRDGENPGRIADALARRAEPRYPSGHVIPLMPSWTLAAMNPAAFYARLALDAGLDDTIDSRESFHAAAARRLRSGRWCWIVTGFENAPEADAQYFARAIVEWTDANGEFRIILCGGERLHDLRDANGLHSLLSRAQIAMWPDLTADDIRRFAPEGVSVDDATLARILDAAGGHPLVVRELLEAGNWDAVAMEQSVSSSHTIWNALNRLVRSDGMRRKLERLVENADLGPSQPYYHNDVLRHLFWRNLVCDSLIDGRRRLVWRCDAVRSVASVMIQDVEANA